jgi:hypothetical protein
MATLKVVPGSGLQGSNYNPQQTQPGTKLQNTVTAQQLQPTISGRVLQPAAGAKRLQPAASIPSASAVAAAAESRRQAAAAEAARQHEILRQQVQLKVNTAVAAKTTQLKLAVEPVRQRLKLLGVKKPVQPVLQDNRDEYQKERDAAYNSALSEYDKQKSGGGGVWDTLTFGSDRRAMNARGWAESRLKDITDKQVGSYSKNLDKFLSEQAKRRQAIESAKFTNRSAFDRAVADYNSWEGSQIAGLNKIRASLEGSYNAYSKFASDKLTTPLASFGSAFSQATKPLQNALGKVWQYTLGSGDQNLPSLVTAPSRAINTIRNVLNPSRTIYKAGGGQEQLKPGANPWTSSFNQRNFNIKPYTNQPFDKNKALAEMKKSFDPFTFSNYKAAKSDGQRDKILHQFWDKYNQDQQVKNNVGEFIADPLLFSGLSKVGKAEKVGGFLGGALKKVIAPATNTKIFKWLTAEAKSPQQKFVDAVQAAKAMRTDAQGILPRVIALRKKLEGPTALDYGVFQDLASLSDKEASILQKMVGGKMSQKDWFVRGGFFNPQLRDKLQAIAARYKNFTDTMASADKVTNSSFLGSEGKQYFARTNWLKTKKGQSLDTYDFRLKKTKPNFVQSASDLHQSQVDRLFKSDIENWTAQAATKSQSQAKTELDQLLQRYDKTIGDAQSMIEQAHAKTKTPYARVRGLVDKFGPTSLWKKSVLKYRPAWYLNNFLYNTQAAALAGGPRALAEHVRLLRPKNYKSALEQVPTDVQSKVANEIGKGKIAKFGNRLENWSRVSAFRALKKKGFTDDAALKRVNRYLFDYTTKNWERPLKSVVPFWSFQKNLTKAAVQMPFDRPIVAKAYNQLDRYQQNQFKTDFDKVVPRLKELGYTDPEIETMRQEQAKYYQGRLKVGDKYITTPFNAFSEKGLSNLGLNPFASALGETANATDNFGRPISGKAASFTSRLISKFPQADLAQKFLSKLDIKSGRLKPNQKWIGAPGSEGYGLTKEAQGYDPSKPNYRASLDTGAKFNQDLSAFFGAPRGIKFDASTFLSRKVMQKLKDEYFSVDWSKMDFPTQEAKRADLFRKYGITADQFYKGELAKYDSDQTKKIKQWKEEAQVKTKKLFDEYARQPKGTRNAWATVRLKELVNSGYFATNPFLKTFKWTDPDTIQKAYKQISYYGDHRKHSSFSADGKFFKSAESMQRYKAGQSKKSFWTKYYATSDKDTRRILLRDNPQFAKNGAPSGAKVAEAKFWASYATSDKVGRRQLLKDNPQFNQRGNWTAQDWLNWKIDTNKKDRQKLSTVAGFTQNLNEARAKNSALATPVLSKKKRGSFKKLVFNLS